MVGRYSMKSSRQFLSEGSHSYLKEKFQAIPDHRNPPQLNIEILRVYGVFISYSLYIVLIWCSL